MRRLITIPILSSFQGKSQFDKAIQKKIRPSACGPVTANVILRYLDSPLSQIPIDELYKKLGTTRIGLFAWQFIHRLNKLLGSSWIAQKCTLPDMLAELDNGRPVAAKFDQWFALHWFGSYAFDYHWVPVIGYELIGNDIVLAIHDNGSPASESTVQLVSYRQNCDVLTFIKISPNET